MIKFLAAALLLGVSYGAMVTVTTCSSSTTCSGDDCATATAELPLGCVAENGISSMVTCSDGWYNVTSYATCTDCLCDGFTIGLPTDTCIDYSDLGAPGSTSVMCMDGSVTPAPVTSGSGGSGGSGGEYKYIYTFCESSEDCTGSDCEVVEIPISDVCRVDPVNGTTSYTGSCIGNTLRVKTYENMDCSGMGVEQTQTVGECVAFFGSSFETECEVVTPAPTTPAPTTKESATSGQYMVRSAVSVVLVFFVLSFWF